jgi:hypothetical protein
MRLCQGQKLKKRKMGRILMTWLEIWAFLQICLMVFGVTALIGFLAVSAYCHIKTAARRRTGREKGEAP